MPDSGFTFHIQTMGCKANVTDSQTIEYRLREMGGTAVPADSDADIMILNSCTVTDRADKDAIHALKKSKAKHKLFTGCLAEVDPDAVSLGGNTLLLRNSGKTGIVETVQQLLGGKTDIRAPQGDRARWHREIDFQPGSAVAAGSSGTLRTRAFFKIQDGCNMFCSFCIIPHARGRSRSLAAAKIVEEINSMVAAGTKEVVLTAIHAADYADPETGIDYTGLVEKVLVETAIQRVRLTSLDPAEIPDRLVDLMVGNDRLCPHFHVSMQACDDDTLKRMRRIYDLARASDRLNLIADRLPHAFVGMDMIAGFPGETEAEFANTLQFLQTHPWSRLHVFPYSERRSTHAAKLIREGFGVDEKVRHDRARQLRALSDQRMQQALAARVGRPMEVLVENKPAKLMGRAVAQGHTRSYFRVLLDTDQYCRNELLKVQITGVAENGALLGRGIA